MKSSTINWVKRRAKKIKKEQTIPHHAALNFAAETAGFVNWKHLLNSKDTVSPAPVLLKGAAPVPAAVSFTGFPPIGYTRPNTKMPVEGHQKLAEILDYALAVTDQRKSVRNPIGLVRSELDEWVQREHPTSAEMSEEVFHNLYYANRNSPQDKKEISRKDADELVGQLELAKEILARYYHNSTPLTHLHKKLNQAIVALNKRADGSPQIRQRVTRSPKSKQLSRGTGIRIKPFRCDAVVIEHDVEKDTVRYFSDGSNSGMVARHEISVLRDQTKAKREPMRVYLPYGKWTCANGAEVLFDRDYQAMWAKSKTGIVTALEPNTWVTYESTTHYYQPSNPPWVDKRILAACTEVLKTWGVADRAPGTMRGYFELLKTGKKPETKFEHQFPGT